MGRRRGIFLITTLLTLVVLVMILTAAVKLQSGGGHGAQQFADQVAALKAAESGMRYVVGRLQEDFDWRGDANLTVVDQPGLQVVEDDGNVFGFLTTPTGEVSQFRIRFNYQDDAFVDNDGLPDPARLIQSPYVSINNLRNMESSVAVPRSNGAPNWEVPDPPDSLSAYDCPPLQAVLIVEGLAGRGLLGTGPADPNPPASVNQHISRRVIEAYYTQDNSTFGDAVLGAGGDVTLVTPDDKAVSLDNAAKGQTVKMRGLKDVVITNPDDPDLITKGMPGLMSYGTDKSTVNPAKNIATVQDSDPDLLMALEWSEIPLPDTSPGSAKDVHLKAGVYYYNPVKSKAEGLKGAVLYYYDKDYASWNPLLDVPDATVTKSFTEVRSDAIPAKNPSIQFTGSGSKLEVQIAESVYAVPQTNASGIAFFADATVTDRSLRFLPPASKTEVNTFYTAGGFYANMPLSGGGSSLVAGEEIDVENGGMDLFLNPNAETGVNLYAKGDISLGTLIPDGKSDFLDLKLGGIIYTWGAFKATAANLAGGKAGKFELTGMLVAYGDDPGGGNPGDAGKVFITAAEAKLKYDSAYLSGLKGASSGKLRRVLWAVY